MKLLNATFLLAAATTAAQLEAIDYLAEWNLTGGNTATAIIGVDATLFHSSSNNAWSSGSPSAWLTKLNMVIRDSNNNTLGSWTKSDVNSFTWNPTGHDLTTYETNAAYPAGTFLVAANQYGISSSGFSSAYGIKTFAGGIVTIDFAGPDVSLLDVESWLSSVNNENRIYNAGVTLGKLPLEGAHHRPMLSFDRMGQDHQAWATGDFGSSSRTRDVHVTTGEAGVNWNVGKTGLFGFAAGHGEQNADLAFNGSSSTKGDYGLVEYDYRPEGTQWIVSLLGMVGSWESKINRGYTNGGTLDSSYGVADLITRSARLRVDAPVLATFGGFGFAPFASYTLSQTVVGAYTETGGAFPASFGEQSHNSQEGRLGITATKDVSAATKLLLTVEAIHRFDGVGPSLTGQDVTGGIAFSLPGTAPRPDCVRFGFDVDHKLNENTLLNISAHVATVGEEHDVSAAISIRRAF